MNTIDRIYKAKLDIKKSNFLAFLAPICEFRNLHKLLKEEHPKAVHVVWAYRELNKYKQIAENQSDDGEPKGTSGMPTLNALRGADLINCVVFIVRYFGGIKLGTGGLVRAYSSAANLVISEAELIKFEFKFTSVFFTPFCLLSRFEHYFEKEKLKEFEREFTELGAIWTASFKKDEFIEFYKFSHEFEIENFKFLAIPMIAKELFN